MISHPMRLDSAGAVVTVDDVASRAAAELGGHVISCIAGERPLAPMYGIPDVALGGVSESTVAGAIAVCEPELAAGPIDITDAGDGRVRIRVDVEWSQP